MNEQREQMERTSGSVLDSLNTRQTTNSLSKDQLPQLAIVIASESDELKPQADTSVIEHLRPSPWRY